MSLAEEKNNNETMWYSLNQESLFDKLKTNINGLDEKEAEKRIIENGFNLMPALKKPSFLMVFYHQFASPLIIILIIASAFSFLIGEYTDALFIIAIVILNSLIGGWQEYEAEKNASSLQKMLKTSVIVRREGVEKGIDSGELVLGDIVLFSSGNKVPADIRVLETNNLLVDESFLTGESLPVEKKLDIIPEKIPLNRQNNMLFAGSNVFSGRATGVVVGTGIKTEVGKIAKKVKGSKSEKPPLVIRVESFSQKILLIVVFASLFLFILGVARGFSLEEIFLLSVALSVSAIPEGLPVALTVALSVATKRMLKKNVLVRKLTSVEGLGSCTIIASDKTGTLTVNQQTAKIISLPSGEEFNVSGQGYNANGKILSNNKDASKNKEILFLSKSSVLCNESNLWKKGREWHHQGDSIDVAFLFLAKKLKIDIEKLREKNKIISTIPYESERKFAAVFCEENKDNSVYLKGAIDVVLSFCETMQFKNKKIKIDKKILKEQAIRLASKGYRVLAVASSNVNSKKAQSGELNNKMNFLGFVGFIDPLRSDSKESIEKCKKAGIEVAMITGDHPVTALAIAEELDIINSDISILTGEEIDKMNDKEFIEKVSLCRVFAEVSPLQKFRIVDAMIKIGHFVAVTGDGVNDSPALKKANIGVAMGSGTDVAKETASLIVLNDNFSSIVSGIEEGRIAYDNVRKVVYLLISTGLAEITLFFLAVLSNLPFPFFAVQLLWLNLVTNGIQDVALAFEKGEPGIMSVPPRSPKEGIFNKLMVEQVVFSGLFIGLVTFFVWSFCLTNLGWEESHTRNFLLMLMVLFQNMHVFNCRSEKTSAFKIPIKNNYVLIIGVIIAQGIHLLAMQSGLMQNILGVSPIPANEWIMLLILASSIMFIMEGFKIYNNKYKNI